MDEMKMDFLTEYKELNGLELPENDEFESDDQNRFIGDKGANARFPTIGICKDVITRTNQHIREGDRVSGIVYRENGEWNTYMLRPIHVGCPETGPLGRLNEDNIGGDNVDAIVEFDATVKPDTETLTETGTLTLSDIKIRAGQKSGFMS